MRKFVRRVFIINRINKAIIKHIPTSHKLNHCLELQFDLNSDAEKHLYNLRFKCVMF